MWYTLYMGRKASLAGGQLPHINETGILEAV